MVKMLDEVKKEKPETIRDIAIKLAEENIIFKNNENGTKERTVFLLGSRRVGKTSAINKFLDREENTRPTMALEYSFGRRTSSSYGGNKQILNLWELGELESCERLIKIPTGLHGTENFSTLLFIDLSKPELIWKDFRNAYKGLKNTSKRTMNHDIGFECSTSKQTSFPVIIIGGKYDIFMDFDFEIKKSICQHIRAIAHLIGGSLFFFSSKIPKLTKIMRDTISHLGFDSPSQPFRKMIFDCNEPLLIWFGTDSWDKIGIEPVDTLDRLGILFTQSVPQVDTCGSSILPDNPAKDLGFSESIIDEMRDQKDAELTSIIKDNQLRGKFEKINLL